MIALALSTAFTITAQASQLGVELVVNGGGETGDMTGWVGNGIDSSVPDAPASGFGDFVFTGGTGPLTQAALQTIDVSSCAALIDQGEVQSRFGVFLQARARQSLSDSAEACLTLLDGSGSALASVSFADTPTTIFDWNYFSDFRIVPAGTRLIQIELVTTRNGGNSSDGFFDEVSFLLTVDSDFVRGDANNDSTVDIADAVFALNFLFTPTSPPPCLSAVDSNDDGAIDIADAIYALNTLFGSGPPIPIPHPQCGSDPTPDSLSCETSACP